MDKVGVLGILELVAYIALYFSMFNFREAIGKRKGGSQGRLFISSDESSVHRQTPFTRR